MGNTGPIGANWSVNNWSYGTGDNAVSIETVINETSKIPQKFFGGEAIENDESMQQMHQDLLSIDQTIINMFRRNKSSTTTKQTADESYRQQQYDQRSSAVSQQIHTDNDGNSLEPAFLDTNELPAVLPVTDSANTEPQTSNRSILGCSHRIVDSKMTEYVCRRCNQAETCL